MIINLRGTSGSGKTHLARQIMDRFGARKVYHKPGRTQPIGYTFAHPNGGPDLAVVGHYETACGGCDTIASLDEIFQLVRLSHKLGHHVLFEGLLASGEMNRAMALHNDGLPFEVLIIDITLEECLASVNARRRAKWEERVATTEAFNAELVAKGSKAQPRPIPEEPKGVNHCNTKSKWMTVKRGAMLFEQAGVPLTVGSREVILDRALELLGVTA